MLTKRMVGLFVAAALFLVACGDGDATTTTEPPTTTPQTTEPSDDEVTTSTTPPESHGVIGFSYGADNSDIYSFIIAPAKEQAEARGYELLEGAAAGDCDKQVEDLEGFIARGVEAITVFPICGPEPVEAVLQEAADQGIIVVGYSTSVVAGSAAILYNNAQLVSCPVEGARN